MKLKTYFLPSFFALTVFFASGQGKENDTTIYYNKKWEEISVKDSASFYRIISGYHLKKDKYEVNDYFISGKLQMHGELLDCKKEKKTGLFTWYYETGQKSRELNYENGVPIGKNIEWYSSGKLKEESFYEKSGEESNWSLQNLWDSLGKQVVKDGAGFYEEYVEGKLILRGNYKNGQKEGEWEGFYKSGKPYYKEKYKNGELTSGKSVDSAGTKYKYKIINQMPEPPGGIKAVYKFIGQNVRYPEVERTKGIEGRELVKFYIGPDGQPAGFEFVNSVGTAFDRESERVIRAFGKWTPGAVRGIPVKVWFQIPIRYTLK